MSKLPLREFKLNLMTNESMTADVVSTSQNIDGVSGYSVQFIWSDGASPVGDLSLQVSNDDEHYVDITDTIYTIGSDSGSYLINVELPNYSYVRGKYTFSSGDGTLNMIIVGKIN